MMLVLTRRMGEKIFIGPDITVTIVDVAPGGKVRVGVDAPKEMPVHREEIWNKIQDNRKAQIERFDEGLESAPQQSE